MKEVLNNSYQQKVCSNAADRKVYFLHLKKEDLKQTFQYINFSKYYLTSNKTEWASTMTLDQLHIELRLLLLHTSNI